MVQQNTGTQAARRPDFTDDANKCIAATKTWCNQKKCLVSSAALLAGIITHGRDAQEFIRRVGCSEPQDLIRDAETIARGSQYQNRSARGDQPYTNELKTVVQAIMQSEPPIAVISKEHLLLAMTIPAGDTQRLLHKHGVTRESILEHMVASSKAPKSNSLNPFPHLSQFGEDLTKKAHDGDIDPIIGRDTETRRVMELLTRRTKNNPIIIGEPGTGKAQPLSCLVRTVGGWKPMGDVVVGDRVVTPRGATAGVVGVFPQGVTDVFSVVLEDGRLTFASGDHLWRARIDGGEWEVVRTSDMLAALRDGKQVWLPNITVFGEEPSDNHQGDYGFFDAVNNQHGMVMTLRRLLRHVQWEPVVSSEHIGADVNDESGEPGAPGDVAGGEDPSDAGGGCCGAARNDVGGDSDVDGVFTGGGAGVPASGGANPASSTEGATPAGLSDDTTTATEAGAAEAEIVGYRVVGASGWGDVVPNPDQLVRNLRSVGLLVHEDTRISGSWAAYIARHSDVCEAGDARHAIRVIGVDQTQDEVTQCIKLDDEEELYITDDWIVTHNTSVVEGLARRIDAGDCPEQLKDKRIFTLDLAALSAGASHAGEYEERVKNVLSDIKRAGGQIITFIDEIHMIADSGNGAMNLANIMKPMLSRGEMKLIGATTNAEYRTYIEKDPALNRRFQAVKVSEPTVQEAIAILRGVKEKYEAHHGIKYQDAALVACVELSDRYISGRFLPDKAIDLMDESAAMLRMMTDSRPVELGVLEQEVLGLEIEKQSLMTETSRPGSQNRLNTVERELAEKQEALRGMKAAYENQRESINRGRGLRQEIAKLQQDYELASKEGRIGEASTLMYTTIPAKQAELERIENESTRNGSSSGIVAGEVTPDTVAKVVSSWTGIPAAKMSESETERILTMGDKLSSRVVGQPEAVESLVNAIKKNRAGFSNENRPVGSFLFAGPSGTGKAQPLDALIKTPATKNNPSGWCRMGDIKVGDWVSTPDGGAAMVDGVFPQGKRPNYSITTTDGRQTEASDNHLWAVHVEHPQENTISSTARRDTTAQAQRHAAGIESTDGGNSGRNEAAGVPGATSIGNTGAPGTAHNGGTSDGGLGKSTTKAGGWRAGVTPSHMVTPASDDRAKLATTTQIQEWLDNGCRVWIDNITPVLSHDEETVRRIPEEFIHREVTMLERLRNDLAWSGVTWVRSDTEPGVFHATNWGKDTERDFHLGHLTERLRSVGIQLFPNGDMKGGWVEFVIGNYDTLTFNTADGDAAARVEISAVKPVGVKEVQCIHIAHPRHLYITDDHIVTHNTEISKALAEFLYDSDNALITYSMEEYSDSSSVNKLMGAPAGYVGYDDEPALERVRRHPSAVVLFDEMEKANDSVITALLSVLEEGHVTLQNGKEVDFTNAIIIFTSNIGAGGTHEQIMEALKRRLRAEFINRIDAVIPFNYLDQDALETITEIQLARLQKTVGRRDITLKITDTAKEFIALTCSLERAYGARPVRRMFEGYISEILADKLLHGEFTDGDTIIINTNDGSTELTITKDTATGTDMWGLGGASNTDSGDGVDGGNEDSAEIDGSIFDEPEDNGQAFNLDNVNETGLTGTASINALFDGMGTGEGTPANENSPF
jgi:ATP-dependent clp protease, ATP-binding subunit clpB